MENLLVATKKKSSSKSKTSFFEPQTLAISTSQKEKVQKEDKNLVQSYETINNPKIRLAKSNSKIKTDSKKLQQHKSLDTVAGENQKAAILTAEKTNKTAAERAQVEEISKQETKEFDVIAFKNNLNESINNSIKNLDEANKISKEGVSENFNNEIDNNIKAEKENSGGDVQKTTSEVPKTPSDEFTQENPQTIPNPEAQNISKLTKDTPLAPEKRQKEEVDFAKDGEQVDSMLKENNLTDEKLQNSKDDTLIGAYNTKNTAKTIAEQNAQNYNTEEKNTILQTQQQNRSSILDQTEAMKSSNTSAIQNAFLVQNQKKSEEITQKETFSNEINTIYTDTKTKVGACFIEIDKAIEVFKVQVANASKDFKSEVEQLIDDNDGWEAFGKWVTQEEVLDKVQIFDIAKKHFKEKLEIPVNTLSDKVGEQLSQAQQHITEAKNQVEEKWNALPDSIKKISEELYNSSKDQFAQLEESIKEKESGIISTVSEIYSQAYGGLKEIYEKALEDSKSWWEKAIDAVKSVINTIKELKATFDRIAAKVAKYSAAIMDDPGVFFDNLATGIGNGFKNFRNNIDKHLIKGAMIWLTGSMGNIGIVMPEVLDLKGILSLLLQILGIDIQLIKNLIKAEIGEKRYNFLEKGVEIGMAAGNKIMNIIQILNTEGIAGLWEFMMEEIATLKDQLINTVIQFLTETLIGKAIEKIVSMLIPGLGLISAIKTLIDFVATLFAKAAEIMQIIEAIIDTFGDILAKNLGAVTQKVENIFGGFLSLAISFLAGVLGLNGLAKNVQNFIQKKIQPQVKKALKKIAKKVKEIAYKIGLTKLVDGAMKVVDKAKEKGQQMKEKILGWLGLKKSFKATNNETHTINIENENNKSEIIIKSNPKTLEELIADFKTNDLTKEKYKSDKEKYDDKIKKAISLNKSFKKNLSNNDPNMTQKVREEKFAEFTSSLIDYIKDMFADIEKKKRKVKNNEAKNGVATKMNAEALINDGTIGEKTSEGKGIYETLSYRRRGAKTYYVQGHLLNAELGGKNDPNNLTPLTNKANSDHKLIIENSLKHYYEDKKALKYTVTPIYGLNLKQLENPNNDSKKSKINSIRKAESASVPVSIQIKSSYLTKENNKEVEKPIFNGTIMNNVETNEEQYKII